MLGCVNQFFFFQCLSFLAASTVLSNCQFLFSDFFKGENLKKGGKKDRQTKRQKDRQTERQKERKQDRKTERLKNRKTERQNDRKTGVKWC